MTNPRRDERNRDHTKKRTHDRVGRNVWLAGFVSSDFRALVVRQAHYFTETIVPACVAMVLVLAATAQLRAQAEADWVGKRVVPRNSRLRPPHRRRTGRDQPQGNRDLSRRADRRGPSLWLQAEGQPRLNGWAKAEDVIPFERAIDFFTEQIRVASQGRIRLHHEGPRPARQERAGRRDPRLRPGHSTSIPRMHPLTVRAPVLDMPRRRTTRPSTTTTRPSGSIPSPPPPTSAGA